MTWIIGIALLVIVGFILDREIYFYEGVHLGPRVQSWLYDQWAKKYDAGKHASQLRDPEMLAQPLLAALQNVTEPFVLDFATGTGRLSYALTSHPDFKGHIIALDLSQGMLEQAAAKLNRASSAHSASIRAPLSTKSVELLRHLALPLPFPDQSFDVVCALEVLELFPKMDQPLAEFSRVLRPGGIFLTSRGTEESGRRAKVKSKAEFEALLTKNDFTNCQISPWWKLFDRVIAMKNGSLEPTGSRELSDVLHCTNCGQIQWQREDNVLSCGSCGRELAITKEGIVLN
ncbi:MAG TPA: class I SAM-dependent methyltransferase [Anaerolineales bacterium]|nr:class I SAM-dependent methyltransferase [Anaerolineales bacterium]